MTPTQGPRGTSSQSRMEGGRVTAASLEDAAQPGQERASDNTWDFFPKERIQVEETHRVGVSPVTPAVQLVQERNGSETHRNEHKSHSEEPCSL